MPQYRKKPIIIEAVRFVGNGTSPEIDGPEPHWYEVARTMERDEVWSINFRDGSLAIHTLEGVMQATRGDWIIRGIAGEVYPCKDEIFRATYQLAEEATP